MICRSLFTILNAACPLVTISLISSGHGRRQNFFQVEQSRHFAYPFQVVDDVTQMDVHKMPHPFYITKKMPNVTATVADSVFPLRKFYTKPVF